MMINIHHTYNNINGIFIKENMVGMMWPYYSEIKKALYKQ